METLGPASVLRSIAQFGIQLSNVLVTVIGKQRDAANNVNCLRDEILLASTCLNQLSDLIRQDPFGDFATQEAIHLGEQCRAVFGEIRMTIRKDDVMLHPSQVSKDEIDAAKFQPMRWTLWTKKNLESPRQNLDRLKHSMTLCFVSQMATIATTDRKREEYAAQIPGIKRSLAWSGKQEDHDSFRGRLEAAGLSNRQIAHILSEDIDDNGEKKTIGDARDLADLFSAEKSQTGSDSQVPAVLQATTTPTSHMPNEAVHTPLLKVWSIEPLNGLTTPITVSQEWTRRYIEQDDMGDRDIVKTYAKLHYWFKNEIDYVSSEQNKDPVSDWTIVSIRSTFKHRFSRGIPESVQVVMKSSPKSSRCYNDRLCNRSRGRQPIDIDDLPFEIRRILHRLEKLEESNTNAMEDETTASLPNEKVDMGCRTLKGEKQSLEHKGEETARGRQLERPELPSYSDANPVLNPVGIKARGEETKIEEETDEEIIAKQLALYR